MVQLPETGPPAPIPQKRRRPIFRMLIYAITIYVVGFIAIILHSRGIELIPDLVQSLIPFGPSKQQPTKASQESPTPKDQVKKPSQPREQFLREAPIEDNLPALPAQLTPPSAEEDPQETTAIHLAPPKGPTPPEVKLASRITIAKCWDEKGFEHEGHACDFLSHLAESLEQRLYVIDDCRKEVSASTNTGLLSLLFEADFVRRSLSFWSGDKTTLRSIDPILECLGERLKGLDLLAVNHQFSRYHLHTDIAFSIRQKKTKPTGMLTKESQEKLGVSLEKAKEVQVTRERVRVRKSPVDGEILGFISQPRKVRLIEQNGDWCLVKTPRGNVGWMVCWALEAVE